MLKKISAIISTLLSEAWLVSRPDWEPAILFIGSLGSLIVLEKNEFYNNLKIRHDSELYKKFLEVLPSSSGSIDFIRDHDFHNSFELEKLNQLRKFAYEWDNAEHEFIDRELEGLRKELLENIFEFIKISSLNTFPLGDRWQTAIPNYEENGDIPVRARESIKKMNDLGDIIFDIHQKIIRIGKRKLGV